MKRLRSWKKKHRRGSSADPKQLTQDGGGGSPNPSHPNTSTSPPDPRPAPRMRGRSQGSGSNDSLNERGESDLFKDFSFVGDTREEEGTAGNTATRPQPSPFSKGADGARRPPDLPEMLSRVMTMGDEGEVGSLATVGSSSEQSPYHPPRHRTPNLSISPRKPAPLTLLCPNSRLEACGSPGMGTPVNSPIAVSQMAMANSSSVLTPELPSGSSGRIYLSVNASDSPLGMELEGCDMAYTFGSFRVGPIHPTSIAEIPLTRGEEGGWIDVDATRKGKQLATGRLDLADCLQTDSQTHRVTMRNLREGGELESWQVGVLTEWHKDEQTHSRVWPRNNGGLSQSEAMQVSTPPATSTSFNQRRPPKLGLLEVEEEGEGVGNANGKAQIAMGSNGDMEALRADLLARQEEVRELRGECSDLKRALTRVEERMDHLEGQIGNTEQSVQSHSILMEGQLRDICEVVDLSVKKEEFFSLTQQLEQRLEYCSMEGKQRYQDLSEELRRMLLEGSARNTDAKQAIGVHWSSMVKPLLYLVKGFSVICFFAVSVLDNLWILQAIMASLRKKPVGARRVPPSPPSPPFSPETSEGAHTSSYTPPRGFGRGKGGRGGRPLGRLPRTVTPSHKHNNNNQPDGRTSSSVLSDSGSDDSFGLCSDGSSLGGVGGSGDEEEEWGSGSSTPVLLTHHLHLVA